MLATMSNSSTILVTSIFDVGRSNMFLCKKNKLNKIFYDFWGKLKMSIPFNILNALNINRDKALKSRIYT